VAEVFKLYDTDADGLLQADEIAQMVHHVGYDLPGQD
jgi:Ca2+-binding EF-hand superfamily protein